MMWYAWNDYKGKTAEEAMTEWLIVLRAIFERNGVDIEDPRKEIETAEYTACFEKSLDNLDLMVNSELVPDQDYT